MISNGFLFGGGIFVPKGNLGMREMGQTEKPGKEKSGIWGRMVPHLCRGVPHSFLYMSLILQINTISDGWSCGTKNWGLVHDCLEMVTP
ncbi:MAG: hypothetical protein P8X65_07100 [Syntrophobacterales bacterium]